MKKLLFVVTSLASGGAERNVSILCNEFVKQNISVSIFLLDRNEVFYKIDEKVDIICSKAINKSNKLSKIPFWLREIRNIIKERKIDTVVSIGLKYGIISALSIRKKNNIKLILRGTSTYKMSLLESIGFFFAKNKIDTIVCQTNRQVNMYPTRILKKCKIISNPFYIHKELNPNNYNSNKIISIGRINLNQKRQDFIVQAFDLFCTKNPDYQLYLYGSYTNENIELLNKIIENLKSKDHIHIMGECKDLIKQVKNAKLFLCASVHEGMPNALIECMLLGIPCLTTKWDGCKEIITDMYNGFICECNDILSYSKRIEEIVKFDKFNYGRICQNAKKNCEKKYSSDLIIKKWLEII